MNLLVVETQFYGQVFQIGQELSRQDARVLELAPFGQQGYLMAEVSENFDLGFYQNNKNQAACVVKNLNDDLLSAYLSLKSSPLKKYMLFLNFSGPVEAFQTAQELIQKKFDVVDFRFLKYKKPVLHLILTTDDSQAFEKLDDKLKSEAVFFEANGEFLKDYFSISAE